MAGADTFLTILHVMVDDFRKHQYPPGRTPGPKASLTRSEAVTLIIFSRWARFRSERDFHRYAVSRLRPAFPALPRRSRSNRLTRRHYGTPAAFFRRLADLLQGQRCVCEALDSSGVPARSAKRRGAGRLPGQADIGWSNRLGWYEGFRLLLSGNPEGVITGFSFAAAGAEDQTLAGDFFAFRHTPHPRLPTPGAPARGWYIADKGFGQGLGRLEVAPAAAGLLWRPGNLSAQAQQQQPPAPKIAPPAGWDTPNRGDGLRQAPLCFRAGPGAPAPTGRLSNQVGGESCLA